MRKVVAILFAAVSPVVAFAIDCHAFKNPNLVHRPETWFHLIGGNVSRDGLVADLDAIREAGISGIQLFHGKSQYGEWPGVTNQIECLSENWDSLIRFVAEGCAERGLSFKMQNCPGWSMSGGPWIAPSNAMRNLSYSRSDALGGKPLRLKLPVPHLPVPEVQLSDADRDYRDLFVLAFPQPEGDILDAITPMPDEQLDSDGVLRLVYRFPKPVSFHSMELPPPVQMNRRWEYAPGVCVSVNGGRTVDVPQGCWQDNVPFTLAIADAPPRTEWTIEIRHMHDIKIPFVRFRMGTRLDNWEGKAGWVLRGLGEQSDMSIGANACIASETAPLSRIFERAWKRP